MGALRFTWQLGFALLCLVPPFEAAAATGCSGTALTVLWLTPSTSNFTAVAGLAQSLTVKVTDNCGNPVQNASGNNASVVVSFSDANPPINLLSLGSGIWSGSWAPGRSAAAQVTITASAFNVSGTTIQSGRASILGSFSVGSPSVALTGVLNAASFVFGPLSPGALVAVFGSKLADGTGSAPGPPYPTAFNGAQVYAGERTLPLLFTSPNEIVAQIPYDIPVNTELQMLTQRDVTFSIPLSVVIASASPGIFTVGSSGAGQGVIFRADGVTLAQPGTPASAGEVITIYCTGLGAVNPGVPAGTSPPSALLSLTVNAASVSIGTTSAQVSLSALAPGQPGVYRVSAVVPPGISGDAVPVIVTVDGQSSQSVSMAVTTSQLNPTTIQLASSPSQPAYGQNVILTARVTPATATGTVTFKDRSSTLGSVKLTNGVASLTLSSLPPGQHALTAAYSGDSSNSPGISPSLAQAVSQAPTSITLTSSINPSAPLQIVTLIATVSSNASVLSGTVSFQSGSTILGVNPLVAGTATLTINSLPQGMNALTAVFSGDSNNAPSFSGSLNQIVNAITSTCSTQSFTYTIGQTAPGPGNCSFAALAPAAYIAASSAPWLTVSPASGTLGTSPAPLAVMVKPSGLSVGTYAGSFTISGPQLGSVTVQVQLNIASAPAPTLIVTPATVSLSYPLSSSAAVTQTLTVSSNGVALPFTVSVTTSDGGNWLTASATSGTTPSQLTVSVSNLSHNGSFTGSVTIASPDGPSVIAPIDVQVQVLVFDPAPPAPKLSVDTTTLNPNGIAHSSPVNAYIQVTNSGTGDFDFTASTSASWLITSPASGTVDQTHPAVLTVNADPRTLDPGTYQGTVSISGAGATVSIPVTFTVSAGNPSILLAQAGVNFTAVSGAGAPLPQTISILNVGTGSLNWTATASTLSGDSWLILSSNTGTVQRPYLDVSTVNATIDSSVVATLRPGNYYGQIRVVDSGGLAANSPQVVTVILTVLPQGSDPGPEIQPSSLIFTGQVGTSPIPQTVTIGIRKAATDHYISGLLRNSGFTYAPAAATLKPSQPTNLQVIPDFSSLAPGQVLRDTITLQFDDGTARTIGLLTVVAPKASANSRLQPQLTDACANLILQWRQPSSSPPAFSVVRGQSQLLEVQVIDSCGNLIGPEDSANASIQAVFSNQDHSVALVHIGNGVWTGTWTPANLSTGPVTVQVAGSNSSGVIQQTGSSAQLLATLLTGETPLVTAGGVQNDASQVMGGPIAPGTLITLNGFNLASADPSQPGPQVFLGATPLPVFSAGVGYVNVLIPYDVPVNTTSQVTVQVGLVQSMPQKLVVAEAQPAVFTLDNSGTGPGNIYKSDGATLAQGETPARVGETIYIQCTGLGAITRAGAANGVTVTINGVEATVLSSSVAPGTPGIFQIAAIVPDGSNTGDNADVPVTIALKGQYSPTVTMRKPGPRGGTPGIRILP